MKKKRKSFRRKFCKDVDHENYIRIFIKFLKVNQKIREKMARKIYYARMNKVKSEYKFNNIFFGMNNYFY